MITARTHESPYSSAFEESIVLHFTRVLDTWEFGAEPDEGGPAEPADRAVWEKRANPESLGVADGIISLIPSTDGPPRVTYNRGHIAAGTSGRNFLWLHPRRSPYCHIDLRVGNERRAGLVERIGEVDLAMGTVRDDSIMWLKLTLKELEANKDMLRQAIHEAEELSRS